MLRTLTVACKWAKSSNIKPVFYQSVKYLVYFIDERVISEPRMAAWVRNGRTCIVGLPCDCGAVARCPGSRQRIVPHIGSPRKDQNSKHSVHGICTTFSPSQVWHILSGNIVSYKLGTIHSCKWVSLNYAPPISHPLPWPLVTNTLCSAFTI